jgi:hypothetical protein
MKTNARALAVALFLGANAASAASFVAVGENAELFLTASASVALDDNIYIRATDEVDDVILSFTPGLDFVFGRNAATSGNVYYRHKFLRYSDYSMQDTDLADLGLNTVYANGKSKLNFGAAFAQFAQNDASIAGTIIERDLTSVRASGEVGVTEKTSIGAGASLEKNSYTLPGFIDSTVWNVPVDLYFEYSPKLQTSVGYRYRNTELSGAGLDSKDHFFSVGARGEFTPKLTGQIRIGYTLRDFANNTDDSDLGAEANLTYAFSEKTSLSINALSDYSVSPVGASTQIKRMGFSSSTRVSEQWSWNANLSYGITKYGRRDDSLVLGGLGLAYTYSNHVNFSASYSFRSNSSDPTTALPADLANARNAEFDNNVFSLAANIRY